MGGNSVETILEGGARGGESHAAAEGWRNKHRGRKIVMKKIEELEEGRRRQRGEEDSSTVLKY